jgi:HlyD family secretion protein
MPPLDARDPDIALAVRDRCRGPRHRLPRRATGRGRAARHLTLIGAVASVLALTVAGCGGGSDDPLRAATVGRATVVETVDAPVVVTARATATVTAPADGTVGQLRVHEGQRVREGQILLRVGSPDAHRRLRLARQADSRAAASARPIGLPVFTAGGGQAGAGAERAFAHARLAVQRLPSGAARTQTLSVLRLLQSQYVAARTVTDQAVRQFSAGVRGLSAAIVGMSSAQRGQTGAAVQVARRTVAALTVRAPVAGTVSLSPPAASKSHSSDASQLVAKLPASLQGQAGGLVGGAAAPSVDAVLASGRPVRSGQPILTVTDTSTLTLTAQVDETDVLLVKKGIAASATLDAVPDATYVATVTTIDPAPTTSSRGGGSYVVRLSLGSGTMPDGSVAPTPRPGMKGDVKLNVRTARHTVAVPAIATFRAGARDAVWVVKNGVTHRRMVRLGAQGETRVQVVEGLQAGERIVVRGVDGVRDGEPVS